MKILNDEIEKTDKKIFSGDTAFLLYDTFGFPLDLTQDILKESNISVDLKTFNKNMNSQRKKAKSKWKGSGDTSTSKLWYEIYENEGPTEFVGYNNTKAEGSIIQIVKKNKFVNEVKIGDEAIIITNQTPFYAESGGQIGDTGIIKLNKNEFEVKDTKKILKIHLHFGKVIKGEFKKKQNVNLIIDNQKRKRIKIYHSLTHLIHSALRAILGKHVTQKGSLVSFNKLRFDFSHPRSLENNEIKKIEMIVNKIIKQDDTVNIFITSYKKAVGKGAMALFGEKYDDEVRVVSMGKNLNNSIFSIELCGGTHVNKTSEIESLKITKESSVSSGIRRIEAISGIDILKYSKEQKKNVLEKEKDSIKKKLEEKLSEKKTKITLQDKSKNLIQEGEINSIKYYFRTINDLPPNHLPNLLDEIKLKMQNTIIVLYGIYNKNISIVVGTSDSFSKKINAIDIVKKISNYLGGKGGGGRPDFARAGGGKDINKISEINKILIESFKAL